MFYFLLYLFIGLIWGGVAIGIGIVNRKINGDKELWDCFIFHFFLWPIMLPAAIAIRLLIK